MNGLAPDARQRIRALIIQLSGQGRTVLLSSHDLHVVESLCGQLLVLDAGLLAFDGSTGEFIGASQMTILRMDLADTDRAQVLLADAGMHCRRAGSGALVVFRHDASAANRVLGEAGVQILASEERHATLEERFYERLQLPEHSAGRIPPMDARSSHLSHDRGTHRTCGNADLFRRGCRYGECFVRE